MSIFIYKLCSVSSHAHKLTSHFVWRWSWFLSDTRGRHIFLSSDSELKVKSHRSVTSPMLRDSRASWVSRWFSKSRKDAQTADSEGFYVTSDAEKPEQFARRISKDVCMHSCRTTVVHKSHLHDDFQWRSTASLLHSVFPEYMEGVVPHYARTWPPNNLITSLPLLTL